MRGSADRQLSQAMKLAKKGLDAEAEERFRELLRGEGADVAAKGHFALFLAARGKYEEALRLSSEAKRADGLYGLFHAQVQLAAGQSKDALGTLREFTKSHPENMLGWGHLAAALLMTGKSHEAMKVLAEHPLAGDSEMRARLIAETERILVERGVKIEPKDLLLYAKKPRFLIGLRRQFQARACVALGMKLLDQDEPEAAALVLRSALMLHPEQPVAGFYLGLALLQTGKPEEAAMELRRVPEKSRLAEASRACLGAALYYAGSHREAIELLEGEAEDEVSHYFLGLSHLALGERRKALEEFRKALDRDPSIAIDRLAKLREMLKNPIRNSG